MFSAVPEMFSDVPEMFSECPQLIRDILLRFLDLFHMCSDVLRCSQMFSDDHRCFWIFSRYFIDVLLMFSRCSLDVLRMFAVESIDFNDPKEFDDPQLFDDPSYSMIPAIR